MNGRKNTGISALKLKENDSVAAVSFQDDEDMILITKLGMSIKFSTKEIGAIGRIATGVKGIKLNEGDEVISALPIHKTTDAVGVFFSNGIGKKIGLRDFSMQARGGKGVLVSKLEPGVTVAGAAMISDEDNIVITGSTNTACISAKEIPLVSRSGQGIPLIKNNKVLSIAKI